MEYDTVANWEGTVIGDGENRCRVVLMLLIGAAFALSACKGDGDNFGANTPQMSSSELVGTWEQDDGSRIRGFEFQNDNTVVLYSEDEGDRHQNEDRWSLNRSALSLIHEESEEEGEFAYSSRRTNAFFIAIIASRLYMHVFHRKSGSSGDADGTWVHGEKVHGRDMEREGRHEYSGEYYETVESTLTISGSRFTIRERVAWRESESGEGESYSESDSEEGEESGTVRLEGDMVFLTTTEENGQALDSEDQYEHFLGWVLGDVVVTGRESEPGDEPGPESYYERQ